MVFFDVTHRYIGKLTSSGLSEGSEKEGRKWCVKVPKFVGTINFGVENKRPQDERDFDGVARERNFKEISYYLD